MVMSLMLLYVLYRIIRLADILDIVKRKVETEAKSSEMEAEINLTLIRQIAESYGVDISEPTRLTKTEKLMKRLADAKKNGKAKPPTESKK